MKTIWKFLRNHNKDNKGYNITKGKTIIKKTHSKFKMTVFYFRVFFVLKK